MGSRALGLGYWESINLWEEEFAVLAQGNGVDLSTRINLDSHQLSAIMGGKLKPVIKGYLAVRCTQCTGNLWAGPWFQCCW